MGIDITTPVGGVNASNLTYLQRNLLNDTNGTLWGTSELYDAMDAETFPFWATLVKVSTTVFDSNKAFWVPVGDGSGYAPVCHIALNGTVLSTSSYTLDKFSGRVTLATAATNTGDTVTATFYACNLWEVAAKCLTKQMNSGTWSGVDKTIKLGPLSKTTRDISNAMVAQRQRINMFREFAKQWRNQAQWAKRVRM